MIRSFILWAERALARGDYAGIARLGSGLGALMWRALPSRRELAVRSVARHLELPLPEARRIARDSFTHNARSFLELVLVPHMNQGFIKDRLIVDNPDLWSEVLANKEPAIITTAHLGAWELLAGLFCLYFPEVRKRLIVVRQNKNKLLNERIFALRGGQGAIVLSHRNVSPTVLQAMRENGLASFLVDHNCNRRDAVFLPFLGETAAVNMGPALLTVRARVRTFSLFLVREEEKYRMIIEPVLEPSSVQGTIHERITAVARHYTAAVEKNVRRYPEQWFWMHNRWKTRRPE